MAKPKEVEIQRAICDYLSLKGYLFWRSNSTPIYDPTRSRFRAMPKYAMRGTPDIIIIQEPMGRFLGLEVKRDGGKMSDSQQAFAKKCRDSGGIYEVVRSVDDVIALGL